METKKKKTATPKLVRCWLALFAFGLDFVVGGVVDKNLIQSPWCVMATAHAPIVTAGVGKQISLMIECRTRNGSLNGSKSLEALFVVYEKKKEEKVVVVVNNVRHETCARTHQTNKQERV
jgi:hypothetical protein